MFFSRRRLQRPNFAYIPNFLEKATCKFNAVSICHFPLGDDYDLDGIVSVLKDGYDVLTSRFDLLKKEAVEDCATTPTTESPRGLLRLRDRSSGSGDAFVVKDLRGTFPHHYKELEAKRFPSSLYDSDLLSSQPQYPRPPPAPSPVSSVQLNFIRGGLLLTWTFHHWYFDGVSRFTWYRIWSEQCRRLQGITVQAPFVEDEAVMRDRGKVFEATRKDQLPPPDVPLAASSRWEPTVAARGVMFALSSQSVAQLKVDANPSRAASPRASENVKFISTFDAVAALMWRSAAVAHSAVYGGVSERKEEKRTNAKQEEDREKPQEQQLVSYGMPTVNARPFIDPPIDPRTSGCMILSASSTPAPLDDIISGHLNLADLACMNRKAVLAVDKHYVQKLASIYQHTDDLTSIGPVPGPFHFSLTAWNGISWRTLDWGPLLGHHVDCVRALSTGFLRNTQIVLGSSGPDGKGLEILLCVDAPAVEHLLKDPVLSRYAKPLF